MAKTNFTAATPEEFAEQFPITGRPFAVWYYPEAENNRNWQVNAEDGCAPKEFKDMATALKAAAKMGMEWGIEAKKTLALAEVSKTKNLLPRNNGRQGAIPQPHGVYGKEAQRRMAGKSAASCKSICETPPRIAQPRHSRLARSSIWKRNLRWFSWAMYYLFAPPCTLRQSGANPPPAHPDFLPCSRWLMPPCCCLLSSAPLFATGRLCCAPPCRIPVSNERFLSCAR